MRILIDLVKRHFLSIISTLLISFFLIVFIFSFVLSNRFIENFLASEYFEQKLREEFFKNNIVFDGINVLETEGVRSAKISINKISQNNARAFKAKNTKVDIDLFTLIFGSKFINNLIIDDLLFDPVIKHPASENIVIGELSKNIIAPLKTILKNVKTNKIFVTKASIKSPDLRFTFLNLNIKEENKNITLNASLSVFNKENLKLLHSQIELKALNDLPDILFDTKLSFSDAVIQETITYNKDIKEIFNKLTGKNSEYSLFKELNLKSILFNGRIDTKNKKLVINAQNTDASTSIKFRLDVDKLLKKKKIIVNDLLVSSEVYNASVPTLEYDAFSRKFLIELKEFFNLKYSRKLSDIKFEGALPLNVEKEAQINISWGFNEIKTKFGRVNIKKIQKDKKHRYVLEFFTKDSLKLKWEDFYESSKTNSLFAGIETNLSGVFLDTVVNFENGGFVFEEIRVNSDSLSVSQNNAEIIAMHKFSLDKNRSSGRVSAKRLNRLSSSPLSIYDLNIDFGELNNFQDQTEITVSLNSNSKDLIDIISERISDPKIKNSWFLKKTNRYIGDNVKVVYTKTTSLNQIKRFFNFENSVFEIQLDKLSFSPKDRIKFPYKKVKLTGLGEDIFFEFTENSSEKKISGSISNWLSIFRKERNLENFNFSIMGLNIHEIIPEIKFVRTSGPIKMKLYSSIENGKNILGGKVDLSLAKVTFPNFSIDKKKNQFGELAFKLLNQNRARFSYKQKNVTLEGIVDHISYSKIDKITYTNLEITNFIKGKAVFKNFVKYKEFNLIHSTVDLNFLKNLKLKKRKKPFNVIFDNLKLKLNDKTILKNLKGEIRAYKGIRGYASTKGIEDELSVTFTPKKPNKTEILIVSKNAGDLLRRSEFYKNGYGGNLRILFRYSDKNNIEGKFGINNFRVRNAPVLAQLISSASIIGLLDNLNGNGLLFTSIEGDFLYKKNRLSLIEGVAIGPSVGLTMSGYEKYSEKNNEVFVEGLISPIYIINGVIKSIPIIGKILGGEKGEGVFGMAYKVEGNSKKPKVFVNPLSILTPGAFRNIFKLDGLNK